MAKYFVMIASDEPGQATIIEPINQKVTTGKQFIRTWEGKEKIIIVKALKGNTPEERRNEAINFVDDYFNGEVGKYY